MPVIKTQAQSEKDQLEKKATYSLKNADRPLDEKEEEAEEKAQTFSRQIYRRIPPIPGTLAYMLRNLRGGNESVIEFLRWAASGEKGNRTQFIKTFLILWENMDEFSRRRPDIFDHLCRKHDIPYKRFWGVLQEGMFDCNDQITQTALSGHKPQFVERLMQLAEKEKNHQDRKLLSDAMKLTETQPLIKIEDKSKHLTVNQNMIPSFSQSIKRSEESINHENIAMPAPRELTEGEQDYIDVETFTYAEEEFEKAAREL